MERLWHTVNNYILSFSWHFNLFVNWPHVNIWENEGLCTSGLPSSWRSFERTTGPAWKMESSHVRCLQFAKSVHMLHKRQISEWSHKRTGDGSYHLHFMEKKTSSERSIYSKLLNSIYSIQSCKRIYPFISCKKKKKKNQEVSSKILEYITLFTSVVSDSLWSYAW